MWLLTSGRLLLDGELLRDVLDGRLGLEVNFHGGNELHLLKEHGEKSIRQIHPFSMGDIYRSLRWLIHSWSSLQPAILVY